MFPPPVPSTDKRFTAATRGKEDKRLHPTTPPPPPAKAVAGDPVPGRRPTDPAATCLQDGLNPAPETWDQPPQTPPWIGGPPDHRGSRIPMVEPLWTAAGRTGTAWRDALGSVLQQPPSSVHSSDDQTADGRVEWPAGGSAYGRYPSRCHSPRSAERCGQTLRMGACVIDAHPAKVQPPRSKRRR